MGRKDVNPMKKDEGSQTERYLAGFKKYHNRGIPIVIDGKETEEPDWDKILETREDNSFYMADFVSDEETGQLREIRFDRVYYR